MSAWDDATRAKDDPWPLGSADKVFEALEESRVPDGRQAHLDSVRDGSHQCGPECALYTPPDHAGEMEDRSNQCSNPEPHEPHDWLDAENGGWYCEGIREPDEVPLTGMAAVRQWLTQDYECNGVRVEISSTGAEYEDDDSPEGSHEVGWGYYYEVFLIETGMYGSDGDTWTAYEHRGDGDTMDEAADKALAVMREHYLEVVKPVIIIQGSLPEPGNVR